MHWQQVSISSKAHKVIEGYRSLGSYAVGSSLTYSIIRKVNKQN